MSGFEHWLDRRAVAIASRERREGENRTAPAPRLDASSRAQMFTGVLEMGAEHLPDPIDPPTGLPAADHRITRSTALKGAAGLLALVGLRASPAPARAGSFPCEHKCEKEYKRALSERLAVCDRRYTNRGYHPGNTVAFLFGTPRAAANIPLKTICDAWVVRSTQSEGDRCLDMCDEQNRVSPPDPVCSQGDGGNRAERAAQAKECASLPPPPPSLDPSSYTPPADDGCANCGAVGGKCCGSATPGQYICACANPSLDCCAVYGCCA